MDECMNVLIHKCMNKNKNGMSGMNEGINKWMKAWVNETNGWMNAVKECMKLINACINKISWMNQLLN